MKNYWKTLVLPILLGIASCTGDNSTTTNNSEHEVQAGWLALDLAMPGMHYALPMLINIPDENTAKGKSEIMEGPSGGTQILAGSEFNLEIIASPMTMAEKKEDIERNPIFKITYLTDEPNVIFYKAEITDTEIVQYHFYLIKEIENANYGIENIKNEDFSETGIQRMIDASKSLRLKEKV
ncbi:MAG: hypothetical protein H0V01_15285 [Bacteroidetes bacterium]|nr:hypothetical protein [Bacteroidota bacterium]HET6244404.1 hypothetical protein [Bacteroidia bacterium]